MKHRNLEKKVEMGTITLRSTKRRKSFDMRMLEVIIVQVDINVRCFIKNGF